MKKHILFIIGLVTLGHILQAQDVHNKGAVITLKNDAYISTTGTVHNSSGEINGDGRIKAATVSSNTTVSPGTAITSIDVTGNFTALTNSTLAIHLDGAAGHGVTGGNDVLTVAGDLSLDGTLALDFGTFSPSTSDIFTVATFTGDLTGTFSTVTGLPDGFIVDYGTYRSGEVVLLASSILAVTWTHFDATVHNKDDVLLEWTTASENNNKGFHIEHNLTGDDQWQTIGWVEGAGHSDQIQTYSFIHRSVSKETHYYRLRQEDLNGDFTYSHIEKLTLEEEPVTEVTLFPNPTSNYLLLQLPEELLQPQVIITDTQGRIMKQIDQYQSNQYIDVSDLAVGSYLLRMTKHNQSNTILFIKN